MSTPHVLDSPDLYTIAWIAALPKERAAAMAMLDEAHNSPLGFFQHPTDTNAYTWGRIADHNIVIASLPAGMIGTVPASVTASNVLASLPQIRVSLLVGIGGGISRPDDGRDIRLGDIVVSLPHGTSGGVIQYDMGKARSNGWERTGFLSMPPLVLLSALGKLQGAHEFEGSRVPELLRATGNLKKGPEWFSHQGSENDRLFKASYDHVNGNNCRNCNKDETVDRDERETSDPEIHYGIIASGNKLVKDAVTRDAISRDLGEECICFEMEAAGLMNHFPCLVIRGICDYADSHKNDRWQRYAAITAAAYAKELLGHIPVIGVQETPRAFDVVKSASQQIKQIHTMTSDTKTTIEHFTSNDFVDRLKEWLAAPDPFTNLHSAVSRRQEGTCVWFFQDERFQAWEAGKRKFLWLHGMPGCGKTVLSAAIIEHLTCRVDSPSSVLFFYFDFTYSSKQSLNNVLCSLIEQLYSVCADCREELHSLFSSCENGRRNPTEKALCDTFVRMLGYAQNVQIVFDALDECSTRKELLRWIKGLATSDHSGLHILATSRSEEEIESSLKRWLQEDSFVSIQRAVVDEDIRAYVRQTIHNDEDFERWKSRPDVREEIESNLMQNAGGMFWWAECQLRNLKAALDPRTLRRILCSLPKDLDGTYARILASIDENYRDQAITLLQFLLYSDRPITIAEAANAIVVHPTCDPQVDHTCTIEQPREILRICSSLVAVVIKEGQEEIQLAHFTVQQYLESGRIAETLPSHASHFGLLLENRLQEIASRGHITQICLAYLSYVDAEKPVSEIKTAFPLAQYSAQYWMDHAKLGEVIEEILHNILNFLLYQTRSFALWGKLFDPDQPWEGPRYWPEQEMASPLYYASLAGLQRTVGLLIERGANVNAQGGAYHTALQAASSIGNVEIVQQLLDRGAEINMQGGFYGSALLAGSTRGHAQVVRLLLDRGAAITLSGDHGLYRNALHAASAEGHSAVARLLIVKGADVNARDFISLFKHRVPEKVMKQILSRARSPSSQTDCQNGIENSSAQKNKATNQVLWNKRSKIVDQESFHGNASYVASMRQSQETDDFFRQFAPPGGIFDAARRKDIGWTPVAAASCNGHLEIVSLLIEHRADINSPALDGITPIYVAAQQGHVDVVKLLLASGADWSPQSTMTSYALLLSSQNCHIEVMRFLLDNGSDPSYLEENSQLSPLILTSQFGNTEVARLLLDRGADIDAANDKGWSALLHASFRGHIDLFNLLLDRGANVNTANSLGASPLAFASQEGRVEIVKRLLEKGANPNDPNNKGESSLQLASLHGDIEIARLLLDNGADVNGADHEGWSPLLAASQNSHLEAIRLLLDSGADVNVRSTKGWSPLLAAAEHGTFEIASLLLDRGADVHATTTKGWFPLLVLSYQGHIEVVRLFLDRGVDFNDSNSQGRCSLLFAAQNGHINIARLFLDRGADPNVSNNSGWRPLHASSTMGHTELAALLFSRGADINATDDEGISPLWAAAENGRLETVKFLLDRGSDANATVHEGTSPLSVSSLHGHVEVARLLLERGAIIDNRDKFGSTPVTSAALEGHENVVRLLLENGADVDTLGCNGCTPLYSCFENGHLQVARLLLQKNADVTIKNNDGWTPMSLASFKGNTQGVRLLLEHGADVNIRGDYGRTPLYLAAQEGHAEMAKLLIENNANINITGVNGCTPLYIGLEHGHFDVAKVLTLASADITIKNDDGWSLITWASFKGSSDLVRYLLDRGAEVDVRDNDGRTPLYVASEEGHEDVVQTLLERGADINVPNNDGGTPVTIALAREHDIVAQFLLSANFDR